MRMLWYGNKEKNKEPHRNRKQQHTIFKENESSFQLVPFHVLDHFLGVFRFCTEIFHAPSFSQWYLFGDKSWRHLNMTIFILTIIRKSSESKSDRERERVRERKVYERERERKRKKWKS